MNDKNSIKHDWTIKDYREYRRKLCRESQRKRRERAMAGGFCRICCVKPAVHGHVTCEACASYAREYQRRNRRTS